MLSRVMFYSVCGIMYIILGSLLNFTLRILIKTCVSFIFFLSEEYVDMTNKEHEENLQEGLATASSSSKKKPGTCKSGRHFM